MKQVKIKKLSKDEKGKLSGGYGEGFTDIDPHLGASNGNCMGGGWFDTNSNCSGNCNSCSVSTRLLSHN